MANKPQVNLKFIKGYGDNFKKLREMKGLTQKQLYDEIHISDKSISLIEKEQREPTIEQINIYSEYFNVSLDYLTGRTKITNPTIQTISELIGLSEEAVSKLISLKERNRETAYSEILSLLLKFGNTEYMLALIGAKISYHAAKKGLKDFELVKNMIDRTIRIDIDGLYVTAYKDTLIEAIAQSELINIINIVSNEYVYKYSKTPAECMSDFKEYEKNISDKLRKGEISADKYSELIDQYYSGGADNG